MGLGYTRKVISFSREELNRLLQPKNYSPEVLVEYFESSFREAYASDVGVWEEYTLKEHTLMVLRQFEKYFSSKKLPVGINKDFFRVLLALHDIGKPKAISKGDKKKQHLCTKEIIKSVLQTLNYKDKDINIAVALVSGDPIGEFIKHDTLSESMKDVKKSASLAGKNVGEFFKLLEIYYKVDAGSYTKDSGGLKSLDHLFLFKPKKGKMDFSPGVKKKVNVLKKGIKEIS